MPRTECRRDAAGFHVTAGRRTTRRTGIDAYAYRCTECFAVGDIRDGRFVERPMEVLR